MIDARGARAGMGCAGMSMIELLSVVAIIAVLTAIVLPAVGVVRNRSRAASTRAAVSALSLALEQYRLEDMRRQLPPADGPTLQYETDDGKPPTTLNLIESAGYQTPVAALLPATGTRRAHADGWRRALRYQVDAASKGGAVKPAPLDDWNATGVQPFAYVWSLGQPAGSEADDAAVAHAAGHWIYRTAGK